MVVVSKSDNPVTLPRFVYLFQASATYYYYYYYIAVKKRTYYRTDVSEKHSVTPNIKLYLMWRIISWSVASSLRWKRRGLGRRVYLFLNIGGSRCVLFGT